MSQWTPYVKPYINTSQNIAKQTKTTYQDYRKINEFEDVGWFLEFYVVQGGEVTKNVTHNNQIDISMTVVSLKNDIQTRDTVEGIKLKNVNSTYYVDFYEGDFWVETDHPPGTEGTDYLTLATVTTDEDGNVDIITNTRGVVGGFRLKSEYGLSDYLRRDGSEPMVGNLDMDGYQINNLSEPVNDHDAARKEDVDSAIDGRRNYILNGDFQVAQDGDGPFTGSGYYVDMWKTSAVVSTQTVTREEFEPGQTEVPGNPRYYLRVNRSTIASTGNEILKSCIEDVRTLAGEEVTLTFWARVATGTKLMNIRIRQIFGSGGSSTQESSNRIFTITTEWQEFTYSVTLPSINGKTIGSNSQIEVRFLEENSYSTFTMDFANVQLTKGTKSLPFQSRPYGQELALCQRYYEKSYDVGVTPGTISLAGANHQRYVAGYQLWSISFKVAKRATPTIAIYSTNTGMFGNIYNTTTSSDIGAASDLVGGNGFTPQIGSPSDASQGDSLRFHWVADARL